MIRLGLLSTNPATSEAFSGLAIGADVAPPAHNDQPASTPPARSFSNVELVYRDGAVEDLPHLLREIDSRNIEVLLLDATDLPGAVEVGRLLDQSRPQLGTIAVLPHGAPALAAADARKLGMGSLGSVLTQPFTIAALEEATHEALHTRNPFDETQLLAFLPAKAGSGCTTVALNVAARISENRERRSLILECDQHSGVLSILLDVEDEESGLGRALSKASHITTTEWRESLTALETMDLLLAHSGRASTSSPNRYYASWADYYHLLAFAGPRYETIIADLPEVINPATAEVVHSARRVFIVSEPEMASLKLAARRREHLEAAAIPREKIQLIVTRSEKGGLKKDVMEQVTGCPVFATLPNDYREIKDCGLEGRIASSSSAFGKASIEFAAQLRAMLEGSEQPHYAPSKLGLLSKLGLRMAG